MQRVEQDLYVYDVVTNNQERRPLHHKVCTTARWLDTHQCRAGLFALVCGGAPCAWRVVCTATCAAGSVDPKTEIAVALGCFPDEN